VQSRSGFARALGGLSLSHTERAIAFLWYYRQTQEFEERAASELANDLHDEGFPKPNITRLREELTKSKFTVRGHRAGSFQLDVRRLSELDEKYSPLLRVKIVDVSDRILPNEWVEGTRVYLEKLVHQINGTYEYGFYDACAALCRRLMESLIIEVYISSSRGHEIQHNGAFFGLEKLIATVRTDKKMALGRNSPKTMTEIKQLGDVAAHDRVYVTQQQDIDDIKAKYRRLMRELLVASGIGK
jgi:hypothetical protein